jgi:hypothetical protein
VIKPAYSVSFLLSINIFVWQNVLYFPNELRSCCGLLHTALNLATSQEPFIIHLVHGDLFISKSVGDGSEMLWLKSVTPHLQAVLSLRYSSGAVETLCAVGISEN